MKTYKLLIRKYNIMINDYIIEELLIKTNDIYHEIGKIYCTTIEDIKRIDYYEVKEKISYKDCINISSNGERL